jgi:hypothetical protein
MTHRRFVVILSEEKDLHDSRCGIILAALRKYRIIKWCSNEMNFSQMQTAKTEGYLVA